MQRNAGHVLVSIALANLALAFASESVTSRAESLARIFNSGSPQDEIRKVLQAERAKSFPSFLQASGGLHKQLRQGTRLPPLVLLEGLPVPPEVKTLAAASAANMKLPEADVAKATKILNAMLRDERWALDRKILECQVKTEQLTRDIEAASTEAAEISAQIGFQRATVVESIADIPGGEENFKELKTDVKFSRRLCVTGGQANKETARSLVKDTRVVKHIQSLLGNSCGTSSGSTNTATALLQADASDQLSSSNSRRHCKVPNASSRVRVARHLSHLSPRFHRRAQRVVNLLQITRVADPGDRAPDLPRKTGGANQHHCKLQRQVCPKMVDELQELEGEIRDNQAKLKSEIAEFEQACKAERSFQQSDMAHASQEQSSFSEKFAKSSAKLSTLNEMERAKEKDRRTFADQLKGSQKQCKEEIENRLYEKICSLQSLRDHLHILSGKNEIPQDCQVSDWDDGVCSQTCGGGQKVMFREVLLAAAGGVECPPLKVEQACMEAPCPKDCEVSEYSGWSACSALCDGGFQERTRSILQKAMHGGDACPEVVDQRVCNTNSCAKACVLQDWSSWSSCSQACGGGTQQRFRDITTEAVGDGHCADEQAPDRLDRQSCNTQPCLRGGEEVTCGGDPIDLVLAVDVSGSVGQTGFAAIKDLTLELIKRYKPRPDGPHVSVVSFSDQAQAIPLMEDAAALATKTTSDLTLRQGSSDFHTGLVAAGDALLDNGREGAPAAVIVLTDGRIADPFLAQKAAGKLQRDGTRLAFVVVGKDYSNGDLLNKMASSPFAENIISVQDTAYLKSHFKEVAQRIVLGTCSTVTAASSQ